MILDVRQRRGVRGRRYAWANSARLQSALSSAGIAYEHHKELAPTTELRQLQYAEDARLGVGKRSRNVLFEGYAHRYREEILAVADLSAVAHLVKSVDVTAMLCVERDPEACHRSLVAQALEEQHGIPVAHLLPL